MTDTEDTVTPIFRLMLFLIAGFAAIIILIAFADEVTADYEEVSGDWDETFPQARGCDGGWWVCRGTSKSPIDGDLIVKVIGRVSYQTCLDSCNDKYIDTTSDPAIPGSTDYEDDCIGANKCECKCVK